MLFLMVLLVMLLEKLVSRIAKHIVSSLLVNIIKSTETENVRGGVKRRKGRKNRSLRNSRIFLVMEIKDC